MQYAEPINNLIKAISRLPGIGEKTATRLALYILNAKREYVDELSNCLRNVKEKVALCSVCMTFSDTDPCSICDDAGRDPSTVCVVSDYKDMMALESMGGYKGRYHILHGSLAPLKGVGKNLQDHLSVGVEYRRTGAGPFVKNMRLDRIALELGRAYFLGTGF